MNLKYFLPVLITVAALAVSGTAAFYSITGLSKLFAGAQIPVMVMATVLEFSKLVTATLLHRYWTELRTLLKTYLSVAVIILILITSLGIYGFLTAAYNQTASAANVVENEVRLLNTNKEFIEIQLQDLLKERSQLGENVADLRAALGNNRVQYTDAQGNLVVTTSTATRVSLERQLDQSTNRQLQLTSQIDSVNKVLLELNLKVTEVENSIESAAELGPLKYVASLTGIEVDKIVNYLVLIIVFVFDPLAISLVLAANFAFARAKTVKEQFLEEESKYFEETTNLDPELQTSLDELLVSKIENQPEKPRSFYKKREDLNVPQEDPQPETGISRNSPASLPVKKKKVVRPEEKNKIVY